MLFDQHYMLTHVCRLTEPLNSFLGRRGTILFTCFFSFASCLGQAFVQTWQQLLVCRLLLGFGIGPKTATIPIYAAECVPERIRGALVSQWQLWDAFGILAGLVTSNIFQHSVSCYHHFSETLDEVLTLKMIGSVLENNAGEPSELQVVEKRG